jgi:hypothetical protein
MARAEDIPIDGFVSLAGALAVHAPCGMMRARNGPEPSHMSG